MLEERYLAGATFEAYVRDAEANQELWAALGARARVPDGAVRAVESLGGEWHLLVLSEDWCGDAVNSVPVLAALAEAAGNLDLRVLSRDENPDLMDAHLTRGSRSIPVVILLDGDFEERGWWGPRPRELQAWVLGPGRDLTQEERYREVRRWYARDRGESILAEVVSLMEVAAQESAARAG